MSDRLPPLNALKVFESAARHLSLKRAAQELNVTPAAISHQIKSLEEYLGVLLFRRINRGLELTPAARAALPKLSEGFACLQHAVETMRPRPDTGHLTISVAPSFAARWLMPRLHRFFAAHPEIDVRVSARMRLANLGGQGSAVERATIESWLEDSDLAVLYGHGDYPGFIADRLLALEVAPICSPQLLQGTHPLRHPRDLRHHMMVHDDTGQMYDGEPFWDVWCRAARLPDIDTDRGAHFSHAVLALEAAVEALGVVATFPVLAEAELNTGRLVLPFEVRASLASSYYVVGAEQVIARHSVSVFREWLLGEARA